MTIIEIGQMTEEQARAYLENIRWSNGPVCPHCGCANVTRLQGEAHRAGTIQCNSPECRQQFTVTVGSVMESTRLPLVKWAMAFHMICSSKKGFSAKQLQRNLELGSYKSAWFMLHRIRLAMAQPLPEKMSGVIEGDETYVGGKPRPFSGQPSKRGRGTKKKPVMVLVQRDGSAVCKPLARVTAKALRAEFKKQVAPESIIMTDQFALYTNVGREFAEHHRVKHNEGEYVRRLESGLTAHTNSAESFFALLKRGHYGVYHQMSKKHLHRYCSEFSFRWTHRKISDTERTMAAIAGVEGKRLLYQTSGKTRAK